MDFCFIIVHIKVDKSQYIHIYYGVQACFSFIGAQYCMIYFQILHYHILLQYRFDKATEESTKKTGAMLRTYAAKKSRKTITRLDSM